MAIRGVLTDAAAKLQLYTNFRLCRCADDDLGVSIELCELYSSQWRTTSDDLDLCCYAFRLRVRNLEHGRNGFDGANEWRPVRLISLCT